MDSSQKPRGPPAPPAGSDATSQERRQDRWAELRKVVSAELRNAAASREREPSASRPQEPSSTRERRHRTALRERRRTAEHELIDEISIAAERLGSARDWNGDLLFRIDGVWRVLDAVGSSSYCLAIADLARALGVSKQTAHELAHAAERAHVVELASNPQDKRILQVLLTPRGRAELSAARTARAIWRSTLLNGLGDREMAATTHVIRVIRQRLERHARELDQRTQESRRSTRGRAQREADQSRGEPLA